jgi:hypothetical protein
LKEIRSFVNAYREGERIELEGGAWLLGRSYRCQEWNKKREALIADYRREKGLSVEDELPLVDIRELSDRAMVGTVILDWGGYAKDGEEFAGSVDGALDEERTLLMLSLPPVADEWIKALRNLADRDIKKEEAEEKN